MSLPGNRRWKIPFSSACFFCLNAALILCGCKNDKAEQLQPSVTFTRHIKPIITAKCAIDGCHVSGFIPGDFNSFPVIREKIVKGTFQQLVIVNRIMPPTNPLPESEIELIDAWIKSGYQEN